MKSVFLHILTLLAVLLTFAPAASAQEEVLARLLEVNLPESLEASWHRTTHSPMLQENLESEGKLYLVQPDKLRWETLSPFSAVTVLDGTEQRGRFRMPQVKDFSAQVLEDAQYTVILTPVRRDLKQMFSQILLTADKQTLLVSEVIVKGLDGEWTRLVFTRIQAGEELPASLFQKP